jgi:hypothetical protein
MSQEIPGFLDLGSRSSATYLEKADARVTSGRREVLVIVEVNITQVPGMCKLLPTPVKYPRTAQVPA